MSIPSFNNIYCVNSYSTISSHSGNFISHTNAQVLYKAGSSKSVFNSTINHNIDIVIKSIIHRNAKNACNNILQQYRFRSNLMTIETLYGTPLICSDLCIFIYKYVCICSDVVCSHKRVNSSINVGKCCHIGPHTYKQTLVKLS